MMQGFDALLEPFYHGKSLTEPIDTAKVSMKSPITPDSNFARAFLRSQSTKFADSDHFIDLVACELLSYN